MHPDVRHEQHGFADVNGDGKPEIFGACLGCDPAETKGYYSADWANPAAAWTYTPVTATIEFPFGGTGWMHGLGFGGALRDLGVTGRGWIAALAGFNVGVELGQLSVVAAVYPILYFLRRHGRAFHWLRTGTAAVVIVLALFWFVERVSAQLTP